MKKITALNMNWDEYSEVIDKATDSKATLIITDGEWDYVCENGYELEVKEINEMVGKLLDIKVSDEEMAKRREKWQPKEPTVTTGYLASYREMVTSGNRGAILEVPKK